MARELWETILCLRRTINTQCWLEGTFGCRRTLLKTLPTNWKTWMISFQSITSNTRKWRGQHNPRGQTTTQLQETTSAFKYNFYHPKRYIFIRTSRLEICTNLMYLLKNGYHISFCFRSYLHSNSQTSSWLNEWCWRYNIILLIQVSITH